VSTTGLMDTNLRRRRQYKSWPEALKQEIVAATTAPGASVSAVARRYDVNANLVFTWRKRFAAAACPATAPQLVPVVVRPEQPNPAVRATDRNAIEIELPNGYRVRVGGSVSSASLRLVLNALERR
jgi:transposase